MKYLPLLWANLTRRKTRLAFTLLSVIFAFLLFGVLMAIRQAFTLGANLVGANRLMTMSAVSLTVALPINYGGRIADVQGVEQVDPQAWVGGYFQDPRNPIYVLAVRVKSFLDIYPEYTLPTVEQRAWLADKRGAIVGAALARQYGWKLGQQIPLRSSIWRDKNGNNVWELTVDGIYTSSQKGGDNQMFMHYQYLDDGRAFANNTVNWFVLKIADPARAGSVAQAVDALFANSPNETRTATEKAVVQNFAAQFGNIGVIVTAVVSAVLFTMLLVTANTMGQSVRERTAELAVLKVLGFSNLPIAGMVLLESLLLTVVGGVLGLLLAYAVVAVIPAALLEFLPGMYIPAAGVFAGVLLMLLLGMLAALLPVVRAMRLHVVAALRSV
ncbi:MAG TPA: ABC transporter permease [Gammaproteobacteria bacterium]|nr:ABC transporter permease [Gammaproteobacteria bacterium]